MSPKTSFLSTIILPTFHNIDAFNDVELMEDRVKEETMTEDNPCVAVMTEAVLKRSTAASTIPSRLKLPEEEEEDEDVWDDVWEVVVVVVVEVLKVL